jgi:hypothetical protein
VPVGFMSAGFDVGLRWRTASLLHVHAAAEVGTLGNGDARRDDVAVDRPVVADIDFLGGSDVADDLADHDDRLGEDRCLDSAVRPDRQCVIAQLDLPLDVTLDGQILAAVQFALMTTDLPICTTSLDPTAESRDSALRSARSEKPPQSAGRETAEPAA